MHTLFTKWSTHLIVLIIKNRKGKASKDFVVPHKLICGQFALGKKGVGFKIWTLFSLELPLRSLSATNANDKVLIQAKKLFLLSHKF